MTEKSDNASRKMSFLQPANLPYFCHVLSFGGNFVFFVIFWCNVLQNIENIKKCSINDKK